MKSFKLLFVLMTLVFSGCRGGSGGTTGGNPGSVLFKSTPFNNTGSSAAIMAVNDFRFCITKLKLKTAGTTSASIEAQLGLVDVSNEAQTTEWGTLQIPQEASVEEVQFELHLDPEVCGGQNFSLNYNGKALTKDLEFVFQFSPAISLSDGDVIQLGLTNIATALEQADSAGKLNNEQISEFLNSDTKGSAAKE